MPRIPNMKAAVFGALCASLVASLSLPASAGEPTDPPRRIVKFADLDLTRSAGVAALYVRIESAAKAVCEPPIARDLGSMMRARTCAAQALSRAVADVNAPLLTSYYLAKSKAGTIILAQRD